MAVATSGSLSRTTLTSYTPMARPSPYGFDPPAWESTAWKPSSWKPGSLKPSSFERNRVRSATGSGAGRGTGRGGKSTARTRAGVSPVPMSPAQSSPAPRGLGAVSAGEKPSQNQGAQGDGDYCNANDQGIERGPGHPPLGRTRLRLTKLKHLDRRARGGAGAAGAQRQNPFGFDSGGESRATLAAQPEARSRVERDRHQRGGDRRIQPLGGSGSRRPTRAQPLVGCPLQIAQRRADRVLDHELGLAQLEQSGVRPGLRGVGAQRPRIQSGSIFRA